MNEHNRPEYGITRTVRTCTSSITLQNVVDTIISRKVDVVAGWLEKEGIKPENCLIIGAYLTGSGVANRLIGQSAVTVLDIYPHLKCLLNPGISFTTNLDNIADNDWDFVMDTTGIGGIQQAEIQRIHCSRAFLMEDPTSDGSDEIIRGTRKCRELVRYSQAPKRGILWTSGLC